jgi:carbamate kinase
MRKKVVIALGGNAIQSRDATAAAQQRALEQTANQLVKIIKKGYDVVITHGNGPQVGNILLQQKAANSAKNPAMPLDTCGAMSQGMIGYWMQNALEKELRINGIEQDVATIVTRVVVDRNDPAFLTPTKPVGPFYTEEEAKHAMEEAEVQFKEDAGRGWRRVVASPMPLSIREYAVIKDLAESGRVVIASGGGGIPVVETSFGLKGIEAVIDKDFSAQKLAELLDVDMLIILTAVDVVYINFHKPEQRRLEHVSTLEMQHYIKEGHFAPGSMLPKVEAAVAFANSKEGRSTIITSHDKAIEALEGHAGTRVTMATRVKRGTANLMT